MPAPPPAPELVIGLVAAVGTRLTEVEERLVEVLAAHEYTSDLVHLSDLIEAVDPNRPLASSPLDRRINERMTSGNRLRRELGADAAALLTLGAIRRLRRRKSGRRTKPANRHAYILRSLKRPEEIETLRRVYGSRLLILSAYAPRDVRVKHLATEIAQSHQSATPDDFLDKAQQLAARDEAEEDNPHGQRLRDTFPLADVFVETVNPQVLEASLKRFIAGVFGYPFHTPTRDEYGMFHARGAALRSADLSRQVGAAVCTPGGDIVSVGCNEVPKPGGGLYWEDSWPDARDFRLGEDKNETMKRLAKGEILDLLKKKKWLAPTKAKARLPQFEKLIEGTRISNLIEFGRAVHAEMAALTDAARRGVLVRDCVLYTTTFPCHGCAKHIVAAGIDRVVYIEPYPKSLADELHQDAVAIDPSGPSGNLVGFEPFVGVAPSAYMRFFVKRKRKGGGGKARSFDPRTSSPVDIDPNPTHVERERGLLKVLDEALAGRSSKEGGTSG